MPNQVLKKAEIRPLIESFIFEELESTNYEVLRLPSNCLLRWNRFDLGFKLVYLDLKESNHELARHIYESDIRSQTLGSFKEAGSDLKTSFKKYIKEFEKTYKNIKQNGFDAEKSLIPLSDVNTIINGSHRVAAAIHTKQCVSCIRTEQSIMTCDYKYFFYRNVSTTILDLVANKFIEYADDVYIAFLWPSGISNLMETESEFSNIIYKKQISLTARGGFNLIIELYKHMDWLGVPETGFTGAERKLVECFPSFDQVTVIAFQATSIEKVKQIKERIRQKNNIGFSSVHITDTNEEAIRISKLVFNENGIHFLNNSEPFKFPVTKSLSLFKAFLDKNNLKPNDIIVDGSTILSLYGIRNSRDIDFLTLNNRSITTPKSGFEPHDSELIFHRKGKHDLICNPIYFIEYLGLKFISIHQLYEMKTNRGEEKDKNDLRLMQALINSHKPASFFVEKKQSLFYFKLKCKKWIKDKIILCLQTLGVYKPVRSFYRRYKKRNI